MVGTAVYPPGREGEQHPADQQGGGQAGGLRDILPGTLGTLEKLTEEKESRNHIIS